MELAGTPEAPHLGARAADWILDLAGDRPVTAIWHNDLATTWRMGEESAPHSYLKVSRPPGAVLGKALDVDDEANRLRWAARWLPVPQVLGTGPVPTGAAGRWLRTAPLAGTNAVAERHRCHPERTVPLLGQALRWFHDALPVADCPWTWAPEQSARTHPGPLVRELASQAPGVAPTDVVVCCGDACAPNVVITDDGELAGYLDLGDLGVGDRWSDIAVALLSLGWNYGPGWDQTYLDAYGITADPERIRFHQQLHELT